MDENIQTVHHQRATGSNPVARFSFYLANIYFKGFPFLCCF